MPRLFHISETVREQLRGVLLDANDLGEFLQHAKLEPDPATPGAARCSGLLPVRRALDPETSQLRRVEVLLHDGSDGWVVDRLIGLDNELG